MPHNNHCDICEGVFPDGMKGKDIPNIGWMCDRCNEFDEKVEEAVLARLNYEVGKVERRHLEIREVNVKQAELITALQGALIG